MAENKTQIPALILAGGKTPEKLQGVTSETERSFIPLCGKPIITHTVNNIRQSEFLSTITMIGNPARLKKEFPEDEKKFFFMEDTGSLLENLMLGLRSLENSRSVVVLTADIPLITSGILSSTILECQKDDAECYYPIVAKSIMDKKFPGGKRTYVSLKEGHFTGGNVFLINPKAVLRNEKVFQRVIHDRKNPIKLAGLFGFYFIVGIMFGFLDIPNLEKKATQILGVTVKAVRSPNPEIAFDIDKEKDFLDVTRFLERKRENSQ
jgi:GTP:adenosylcobinamide-phosphate guanylyltransferase